MAPFWTRKIVTAGMLLGGCTLVFLYLDTAQGTVESVSMIERLLAAASFGRSIA